MSFMGTNEQTKWIRLGVAVGTVAAVALSAATHPELREQSPAPMKLHCTLSQRHVCQPPGCCSPSYPDGPSVPGAAAAEWLFHFNMMTSQFSFIFSLRLTTQPALLQCLLFLSLPLLGMSLDARTSTLPSPWLHVLGCALNLHLSNFLCLYLFQKPIEVISAGDKPLRCSVLKGSRLEWWPWPCYQSYWSLDKR